MKRHAVKKPEPPPVSRATGSRGGKKRSSYKINGALTDLGGLFCFGSIFFVIVGLSGGSLQVTAIGVVMFIVGLFCLRVQK